MPPKYKKVSTMDAAPEVLKFNQSASKWEKRDLDLLGVDYRYDRFDEITIPVTNMPEELVAGTICPLCRF
jgi:hypothetical protein